MTLAARHGLHCTARTLPIDYAGLKRRMRGTTPAFVELVAPPQANAGVVVELLRIESQGPLDWTQLLDAWRRKQHHGA